MKEPQQTTVDQRLIVLLDSLRKSGELDLGELNWYAARRAAIEGVVGTGEANDEGGVTTRAQVASRAVLSRVERRTIEKILSAHGVDYRTAQA